MVEQRLARRPGVVIAKGREEVKNKRDNTEEQKQEKNDKEDELVEEENKTHQTVGRRMARTRATALTAQIRGRSSEANDQIG